MRLKGEMIGKLDRDQRSGVRDQKKNELGAGWKAFGTAGGLTRKDRGQGSVGNVPSVPRFPPRFPRMGDLGHPPSEVRSVTHQCD